MQCDTSQEDKELKIRSTLNTCSNTPRGPQQRAYGNHEWTVPALPAYPLPWPAFLGYLSGIALPLGALLLTAQIQDSGHLVGFFTIESIDHSGFKGARAGTEKQ